MTTSASRPAGPGCVSPGGAASDSLALAGAFLQAHQAAARTVFDRFATADAYLFSVPMWNVGVSYVLTQRIDIITEIRRRSSARGRGRDGDSQRGRPRLP